MRPLTGKDLQDAYLAGHTGKIYGEMSLPARITYEKVTQFLNVRLGLALDTESKYLFVFEESVTSASDIKGMSALIGIHIEPGDKFEVIIIRAGCEVGHGYYAMLKDRLIWEDGFAGEVEEMGKLFGVERANGTERIAKR